MAYSESCEKETQVNVSPWCVISRGYPMQVGMPFNILLTNIK